MIAQPMAALSAEENLAVIPLRLIVKGGTADDVPRQNVLLTVKVVKNAP
ncbi:hypothetical protein [Serratia fonticola]